MFTATRDRIAATTGALYVVLILVGNQMSTGGTSQSSHPSGQTVLKDVAHQAGSATASAGFVLEALGFVAFIGFLAYLTDGYRRRATSQSSTVVGTAGIIAGITMLAVKLASAMPVGALLIDRKTLSPQLAQLLNDANAYAFVFSWLPAAAFVGLTAIGLYHARLIGRPTAYVGSVLGLLGLALFVAASHAPLDGNPLGFLLGLAWVLAVSVRLAVRPATFDPASASTAVTAPPVASNRAG